MKCILLNKKMLNNSTSASNITEKISLKFVKKKSCINNAMYKNIQQSREDVHGICNTDQLMVVYISIVKETEK
jgi:hypothetical protein